MHKLLYVATALSAAGTGAAGAAGHDMAAWTAGAALVGAAFIWLARMIWKTSETRQKICDQLDRLADKHDVTNQDVHAVATQVRSLAMTVDGIDKKLDGAEKTVAGIKATCHERGKRLDAMAKQLRTCERRTEDA